MSTAAKKAIKSKSSKKDIKHDIIQKLEAALIHLKDLLGEKKFNSRVKKAAKIFTHHATPKKPKVKKPAPVAAKKATTVKKKAVVKSKKVVKKETAKK